MWDRRNELRGSLELRGEHGLQTTYDEACNKLNHLVREHDRQEARAEASRLLVFDEGAVDFVD